MSDAFSNPHCGSCGSVLHTGEAKVLFGLTLDELEELATATSNARLRRRLLCAIGLIDVGREMQLLREVIW